MRHRQGGSDIGGRLTFGEGHFVLARTRGSVDFVESGNEVTEITAD